MVIMDDEKHIEARADHQKPKKLIRSQYKDVVIKVDDDIYYLDRLQLALKSEYFEKLFIDNFSERNSDLIEISMIDSDTFSTVVDVIYDEILEYVVDGNNFIPVLMAMDYLQMNIDRKTCESIADSHLCSSSTSNKDIFKLYNFITMNLNYKYLLRHVFEHLSDHVEKLHHYDEFLSIPFDHFIQIVSNKAQSNRKHSPFNTFSEICAKWMFYDLENRLPHMINLVNAARNRFRVANDVPRKDLNLKLSTTDEKANLELISKKFYQLLTYCGEVTGSKNDTPEKNEARKDNDDDCRSNYSKTDCDQEKLDSLSREPKLVTFLRNENFYDITVKAGKTLYKLHRYLLKSLSGYFKEIFAQEYSELAAKCDKKPPIAPNKDKIYHLNEVDSAAFDVIVVFIYFDNVEFTSDVIVRLFKAVHVLKIHSLMEACCKWMQANSQHIRANDVIEILNFTHANSKYKNLNRFFLSNYIVNSWPKINYLLQFADLFKAITLPEELDSMDGNKVYVFDEIDQETFTWIIDYILFEKTKLDRNNIVRILKASELFKIEKLMDECVDWLMTWSWVISARDVREVLRFAHRNIRYEVLRTEYLVKHVMKWPQIQISLFCPISYSCLRSVLMSENLCFDDPSIILDICSKWVSYDIDNRYCLIPQIALAISRNCSVDCDDYSIVIPPDWNECSLDFLKAKIREILSSTSVLPPTLSSGDKSKKPRTEQPVFIMTKDDETFCILNSDWDEIVSFSLCKNVSDSSNGILWNIPMSATMINDNLFILHTYKGSTFFHVYSLSSKKLFSLASDPRIHIIRKTENIRELGNYLKYDLLNCRDEIYCCLENGEILKYLFELNRWMRFSPSEMDKNRICFASDGNKLFRMYNSKQIGTSIHYISEVYSFEQNSWISTPNLPPLTRHCELHDRPEDYGILRGFVFTRDYGLALAALFKEELFLFNCEAPFWRNISPLPLSYSRCEHSVLSQNDADEILYVKNNQLYLFSPNTNQRWVFKKQLHFRESGRRGFLPYGNMISIHKPTVRN